MIDEKKLLEDMKRKCCGVCKKCDYQTFLSHDEHCGLVDEQPKIGEWIPCSEKLPEKSGTYIVTGAWKGKPREIWMCELLVMGSFGAGWCNDARRPIVDAWMPFPEPYKP